VLSIPEKLLFLVFAAVALAYAYVGFRRVVAGRGPRRPRRSRSRAGTGLPRRAGSGAAAHPGPGDGVPGRPWVSFFHAFVFYGFVFYLLVNVVDAAHGLLPRAWLGGLRFGVAATSSACSPTCSAPWCWWASWLLVRRFVRRDPRLSPGGAARAAARGGRRRRRAARQPDRRRLHPPARRLPARGRGLPAGPRGALDAWQPVASALAARSASARAARRLARRLVGRARPDPRLPARTSRARSTCTCSPRPSTWRSTAARPRRAGPYGVLEPLDLEDEAAERFGVSHLEHLRFPQLLDAYACIQCHRCSEVCPANQTGKALSPVGARDQQALRAGRERAAFAAGEPSPRPLLEFAIAPGGRVGLHHLRRLHGRLPGRLRADDRHRRPAPLPGDDRGRLPRRAADGLPGAGAQRQPLGPRAGQAHGLDRGARRRRAHRRRPTPTSRCCSGSAAPAATTPTRRRPRARWRGCSSAPA
jgi:ferredoxin